MVYFLKETLIDDIHRIEYRIITILLPHHYTAIHRLFSILIFVSLLAVSTAEIHMAQTIECLLQHICSKYVAITIYCPLRDLIRFNYNYDRHMSVRTFNYHVEFFVAYLLRITSLFHMDPGIHKSYFIEYLFHELRSAVPPLLRIDSLTYILNLELVQFSIRNYIHCHMPYNARLGVAYVLKIKLISVIRIQHIYLITYRRIINACEFLWHLRKNHADMLSHPFVYYFAYFIVSIS